MSERTNISQKVVFSVDDLCDHTWPSMDALFTLKKRYPNLKVTLFAIPFKTSLDRLLTIKKIPWIEVAVHGLDHSYREMLFLSKEEILEGFSKIDFFIFEKGFKAPHWRLNEQVIGCCNEFKMWVALHGDYRSLKHLCKYGYYFTTNTGHFASWYSHTYDIKRYLPMLLERWPLSQKFAFVSEAIEK